MFIVTRETFDWEIECTLSETALSGGDGRGVQLGAAWAVPRQGGGVHEAAACRQGEHAVTCAAVIIVCTDMCCSDLCCSDMCCSDMIIVCRCPDLVAAPGRDTERGSSSSSCPSRTCPANTAATWSQCTRYTAVLQSRVLLSVMDSDTQSLAGQESVCLR